MFGMYVFISKESIASDAASYAITSNDIGGCIGEVEKFMHAVMDGRMSLPVTSQLSQQVMPTPPSHTQTSRFCLADEECRAVHSNASCVASRD